MISHIQQVADLKQLLKKLRIQESNAQKNSVLAKTKFQYYQNELEKGNCMVDKEQIFLNDHLDEIKDQEKAQKQEVSLYYKQYAQKQSTLSTKYEQLIFAQKAIATLDYELELKRLAKVHSQLLLMELEEVKIVCQTFLGQGIMDKSLITQLSNKEFWFNSGRILILSNIEKISHSESKEMSSLSSLLQKKTQSLVEQQFSLAKFLKKLSKFFIFCNNDVQSVINQLLQIYKFETVYEVSLKNRHDDLNLKRLQHRNTLKEFDIKIYQLDQELKQYNTQANLVQVIEADVGQIQENSLNLMEFHLNNNQRERTSKAQKVIWRLLTFLTNGLYRWVDIIKTFGVLISKDDELIQKCQQLDLQRAGELFSSSVENTRTQAINSIIDKTFDQLGKSKLIDQQKQVIFTYIKNDFVLFNWGQLQSLEKMFHTKIEMFKSFFNDTEDPEEMDCLIQGLSTFICLDFKDLATEAFIEFQKVFTVLLNRFIMIFSALQKAAKKSSKPPTIVFPEQQQKIFKDKRESYLPSPRMSLIPYDEEKRSASFLLRQRNDVTVKGLFGQGIEFKKQALLRKCQQYQYYFDEKGAPQVKKTIIDAIYQGIFDLEQKVAVDDTQSMFKEEQNFDNNYNDTRQQIAEQQLSNIKKKKELENQKEQRESQKIKNYMEKSKRVINQEKQMNELVKLGEKITYKSYSKQFSRSSLEVVKSLHDTYNTFHSTSQSQFKIKKPNSQSQRLFHSTNKTQLTNNSTEERLPTLKTEPDSVLNMVYKASKYKLRNPDIRITRTDKNSDYPSPKIQLRTMGSSQSAEKSSQFNSTLRIDTPYDDQWQKQKNGPINYQSQSSLRIN